MGLSLFYTDGVHLGALQARRMRGFFGKCTFRTIFTRLTYCRLDLFWNVPKLGGLCWIFLLIVPQRLLLFLRDSSGTFCDMLLRA